MDHHIKVQNLIAECIDIEFIRAISDDDKKLLSWLLTFYHERNLHTILSPRISMAVVEEIFSNEVIRDFVLNLTIRLKFHGDEVFKFVEDSIIKAVSTVEKQKDTIELTPFNIQEELYYEKNLVVNRLKNNDWLVTLFSILLVFSSTDVYSKTIERD